MADNSSLSAARNAKNDEFYTQYSDIETEMNAYIEYNPEVFKDKTILLPCDDPEWSNFTKYFASNFTRLGIKKLISTSYAQGVANKQPTLFELKSPLYNPQQHDTHGKLFTLTRDTDGNGTVDTDDIEFTGYLEGDGDFRSNEVKKLRDEADIIITNPPFSLFREFLAWILEADKQFVIIGNKNVITYKDVFPLLSDNKIWLGPGFPGGNAFFKISNDSIRNFADGVYDDNTGLVKFRNVGWFTNIDHGKRHENLILDTMEHNLKFNKKLQKKLEKDYGKLEYPRYDNYDAIEVPFTECIPSDYDGVMGVPITFMDKYNPDQFDIVAFRKGEDGKDLVFTREREREREYNHTFVSLYNVDSGNDKERRRKDKWASYLRENNNHAQKTPVEIIFPLATNLQNGLINDCTINGKKTYVRILIRKAEVTSYENNTCN